MENLSKQKRPCVMIVDYDLDFGVKLADWLAAHSYQAVLVRSIETAIDECRDLRPQAIFIGLSSSEPVTALTLRRLFRTIKVTAPHVPIVTMGGRTRWGQADLPHGGGLRHLHLPSKPIELEYIGRLLQSELHAAEASPNSPSTEPRPSASRAVENRMHARTVHRETTTWIA